MCVLYCMRIIYMHTCFTLHSCVKVATSGSDVMKVTSPHCHVGGCTMYNVYTSPPRCTHDVWYVHPYYMLHWASHNYE